MSVTCCWCVVLSLMLLSWQVDTVWCLVSESGVHQPARQAVYGSPSRGEWPASRHRLSLPAARTTHSHGLLTDKTGAGWWGNNCVWMRGVKTGRCLGSHSHKYRVNKQSWQPSTLYLIHGLDPAMSDEDDQYDCRSKTHAIMLSQEIAWDPEIYHHCQPRGNAILHGFYDHFEKISDILLPWHIYNITCHVHVWILTH